MLAHTLIYRGLHDRVVAKALIQLAYKMDQSLHIDDIRWIKLKIKMKHALEIGKDYYPRRSYVDLSTPLAG